MSQEAYFDAMVRIARHKYFRMPQENKEVVLLEDRRIRLQNLPSLKAVMGKGHNNLIRTLRFNPFSQFYGQTREQLNNITIKRHTALDAVCQLIYHKMSYF